MTRKNVGKIDIVREIREDLSSVYGFHNSRSKTYLFDPNMPNPELIKIFKIGGISDVDASARLREYTQGDVGASCVHTYGELGFDYVILLPKKTRRPGETALFIGEETMHGEHQTEHNRYLDYDYHKAFSGIAREFFGGSGQYHVARKICVIPPGKLLPDGLMKLNAAYDQATDTFNFDINHMVGYELARAAITGENEWKSTMFHEPDEKRLWTTYNEAVVPDVSIDVPACFDDKDVQRLREEVIGYLESIGLKFNLNICKDETDMRGTHR